MRKFAWRKDKFDKRDYLHKMTDAAIPTSFSLAQFCPPVRDQMSLGACTGFGIGGILGAIAKQQNAFKEVFSPTWIYNGARFIEGTLTQDAGAEPGDCMDWLRKQGCLLESYWPYTDTLDKTSPPSKFNPLAAMWPLLTYTRVTGGSLGVCSAIAAGHLVTIGTPWFDKWMDPDTDGKLPVVTATDSVAGGHMTFLFGYDQTTKLFPGQNSWNVGWGKKGTYQMPFSAFDSVFGKLGGYDAYYVTVNWVTPPPVPTTKTIRLESSLDGGLTWAQLYKG